MNRARTVVRRGDKLLVEVSTVPPSPAEVRSALQAALSYLHPRRRKTLIAQAVEITAARYTVALTKRSSTRHEPVWSLVVPVELLAKAVT